MKTATPKKRGRQITGRMTKTESFLHKIAAKIRARAEAHNVLRPKPEDAQAGKKLRDLSALIDRQAGEMREPELPLTP